MKSSDKRIVIDLKTRLIDFLGGKKDFFPFEKVMVSLAGPGQPSVLRENRTVTEEKLDIHIQLGHSQWDTSCNIKQALQVRLFS